MIRPTLAARFAAPLCIASTIVAQQGSPLGPRLHLPALPSAGALVHVPDDFTDLQDAIDAAAPGDRIVVHGGTYPAITIDKPLTLIGDPAPRIENGGTIQPAYAEWQAPIRLRGPGSGRVVLCNLVVHGGDLDGSSGTRLTEAAIDGERFDEVLVFDCDVMAGSWLHPTNAGGAAGIQLRLVDFLLVSGSAVRASNNVNTGLTGSCTFGGPNGWSGILSYSSTTTILLDSFVQGGGSDPVCANQACPPQLIGHTWPGAAAGGRAVSTGLLLHANSTMLSGEGALYFIKDARGNLIPCGQAPQLPPVHTTIGAVELPAGLETTGPPPRVGGTWTMALDPAPKGLLVATREVALAPVETPPLGWVFVDLAPGPRWFLNAPVEGTGTIAFGSSEALIGMTLTAQLLDASGQLSRPVMCCLRP